MDYQLSDKDLVEIKRFVTGFPWMNIDRPAKVGDGIVVFDECQAQKAVEKADAALLEAKLEFTKFVPASGAASRMFKDLFNKNVTIINKFVSNIDKFAFYDKELYAGLEEEELVDFTLGDEGLGYGSKPKGVLKFHRYSDEIRTALSEHFVEAATYLKNGKGVSSIIVTISPEHQDLFEKEIARIRDEYQKRYNVKFDVKTVYQHKWTDTIAVTSDNRPFVLEDGSILHRPAGHGALIHSLDEIDMDVVCIKNIDNVAVEKYLPTTSKWKKVLIGTALGLREQIVEYYKKLNDCPSSQLCAEVKAFFKDKLCIETVSDEPSALMSLLNRPIRVCGMVRNQGEPGGGPFVIREKDGSTSLQILEGAQINPADPHAVSCLQQSTHFNPVDLVCIIRDVNGKRFNLTEFVDEDAGFISSKSYHGRQLEALELPGLWNGAMSRWNTMFVEVPLETFNPVKTVMDLLRPAHQGE